MHEYYPDMKTKEKLYSASPIFKLDKGEWVSLVKNSFAVANFSITQEESCTYIHIHEGATKLGN